MCSCLVPAYCKVYTAYYILLHLVGDLLQTKLEQPASSSCPEILVWDLGFSSLILIFPERRRRRRLLWMARVFVHDLDEMQYYCKTRTPESRCAKKRLDFKLVVVDLPLSRFTRSGHDLKRDINPLQPPPSPPHQQLLDISITSDRAQQTLATILATRHRDGFAAVACTDRVAKRGERGSSTTFACFDTPSTR